MALLFLGGLIALVMLRPTATSARIEIENKSGTKIREGSVEVCKNAFYFSNLPDGSAVGFTCPITMESGYKIKVSLAPGMRFESEAGYVTPGFDFSDTFVVLPNKIQFERREVRRP